MTDKEKEVKRMRSNIAGGPLCECESPVRDCGRTDMGRAKSIISEGMR